MKGPVLHSVTQAQLKTDASGDMGMIVGQITEQTQLPVNCLIVLFSEAGSAWVDQAAP